MIERREFEDAAPNMLKSLWANQVGARYPPVAHDARREGRAMIAGLLARISAACQWLTLLALCAAAASAHVQWAEVKTERDRYARFIDAACGAAGAEYAASTGAVAGQRCRAAIVAAITFRADTERATAAAHAAAMRDRDARATTDARLARTAAARAATERMESADANAAPTNRVDRDWFAAPNDVAGLRVPDDRNAGR